MTRLALLSGVFVFATSQAQACYTVKFNNQSKADVKVVWVAVGCAGVTSGLTFTCEHKDVKAGESKSYNYNWGVTSPVVKVYNKTLYDRLFHANVADVAIQYIFHSGRFVDASAEVQSPPSCGKSYTINLSENKRKKSGL